MWLPHLLIATLAWNDTLYLSGLAGSLFSMAAYVGTVVGLYAVVVVATDDRLAGWVAAAVYGLSANALYLQTTPMGEPLMYLGMVAAVLAVLLWYRTGRHRWLLAGALTCMLWLLWDLVIFHDHGVPRDGSPGRLPGVRALHGRPADAGGGGRR